MTFSEDSILDLMLQLRTAGQLQHAWITQSSQSLEQPLHPAAAILLSDLATHGESRPSELAKRRMVDVSVISRQIAQLAAADLIDRRPAPEDGRASLISVSKAGAAMLKSWRERHLDFVRDALRDWTEEDVNALAKQLVSMNDALRAALRPPDGVMS